jgi:asparagine N-glycosylation enzyme membrane subunit Stt3
MAAIAAIHLPGRLGWLAIVRTSGAVLQPSWDSAGWLLPLLVLFGLYAGRWNRRARTTIVLLFAIVLQAIALFVLAKTQGADTPYMALKMVYLAIYPAAVLAAAGLARLAQAVLSRSGSREVRSAAGWLIATSLLLLAVRPALSAPRAVPVIGLDLYDAGRWTRANVGRSCVDYLVADAETAYWLHLAVLGNPRMAERMVEVDRYDPRTAPGPWLAGTGRPFAIVELRRLPDEIRSRVEIVREFGTAAVIRNPGVMMGDCDLRR